MRSPIHAVLWETWRVTRDEAALKLALGIVGGLAIWAFFTAVASSVKSQTNFEDIGAVFAMTLLVLPHFVGWISPMRLNGVKPGFPFSLLYTRPVQTKVLVGVPLAYLTVVPAAIYLVSALLLRVVFDYPFPLLSVAAWIAILNLALAANHWSAHRMIFVVLGAAAVAATWFGLAVKRLSLDSGLQWTRSPKLTWPSIFDAPLTDYALIVLIGLVAFTVTVAMVTRQRRGAKAPVPAFWAAGAGYSEWLVNLFRISCPTSSATRAQLWFDLKSNGLPALMIGAAIAIVLSLLIAIRVLVNGAIGEGIRTNAWHFSIIAMLLALILGGNAFGIRQKQGRTYVSAFEATQPYDTAELAALKILVRSACVLVALITIGVSVWTFLSFFPLPWQRGFEGAIATLTGYEVLALVFVIVVGVVSWVAASAVLAALRMRYSHVLNVAALLLLLVAIPSALMAMTNDPPTLSSLANLRRATSCAAVVPMVFFTVYLLRSGFAERLLTLRYMYGAVALTAAFGAAWVTLLHAAGVQLAGLSATHAVSMLSPVLLILTISMLVPESLSRIRSHSGSPTDFLGKAPVMNDLELTVALVKSPSSAFAELHNRPRFWFPLLLLFFSSIGLNYWYYSIVDAELFKDRFITWFIGIPLDLALPATYFLLTAMVTRLPQSFKHWFALTCWCTLPILLGRIVSAIRLLLADPAQIDRSVLSSLSLNNLLFHASRGDPWYVPLEILSIPAVLSWTLTIIGIRVWSQRSWAFCATMFLVPSIVTFGIWASFLSQ